MDSSGDLFIADSGNSLVRKVDLSTGVITTVAGNYGDGAGYSGDTGQATAAELNDPMGLAVDSTDDLFIADAGNSLIRKVDLSTGVITTDAGNYSDGAGYTGDTGPATAAELNGPTGVAVDSSGDLLFIADAGNNVVREVTRDGTISTLAGNSVCGFSGNGGSADAAELNYPMGVAVDASGDVFVVDSGNQVVREVSDKTVPTVTLSSSASSSVYGQALTFSATVSSSGGTPSGNVAFFDGATYLGSGAWDGSGEATLTASALPVGTDIITARYSGDDTYATTTLDPLSVAVTQARPTVNLTSSANPAAAGQPVTLAASVTRAQAAT